MPKYNMESGKWECEFCKEYAEEDKRKVNMHEVSQHKKGQEPPPEPEPRKREEPDRTERVPFGVPKQRLNAPDGDGFQYRVFNDNWAKEPGRIQRAQKAGYEKVDDFDPVVVGTNEDGSPIKGVLMRIPKKWYDEDQKLKQKEVDKVDQAIKKGTLEQKAGDNRYIPQGIKIHANTSENP